VKYYLLFDLLFDGAAILTFYNLFLSLVVDLFFGHNGGFLPYKESFFSYPKDFLHLLEVHNNVTYWFIVELSEHMSCYCTMKYKN